uniref:Uncharacterized protein n=1 Tax=Caenorhabditis japonica TaxID=281687 RepID=A0A8R1ILR7_CAEJA
MNAYQGPSWAETLEILKKEELVWNEPRSAVEVMSTVSRNENNEAALIGDGDDDPDASGRVSRTSMRSLSVDDMEPGELGVSGSFCNNTPQMSPCVSEGDDVDGKTLEGKSQLLNDYMQNKSCCTAKADVRYSRCK